MDDAILTVNAGSSSVKFSLFVTHDRELRAEFAGQLDRIGTAPRFTVKDDAGRVIEEKHWPEGSKLGHEGAVSHLLGFVRGKLSAHTLAAVGHRVAHGGVEFPKPVRVNADVVAKLKSLSPLAPLHQPHNLAPIAILAAEAPELVQVACFDTSFHVTQPPVAQAFALPAHITGRGVRRYGFHGLSYEYIAAVLPQYDARAAAGRVVVHHLGNGSSMCAMKAGRSVATTTGFTAVDGLPMGTRCGNLDPGVLIYLMDEFGMDARAIEKLLYQQSGLLGVSGISADMRVLEASPDPRAQAAIDLYVYRIGRELGSLTATLGGLDAVVFTAGIGEHSPLVRSRVCRDAAWLGIELDEAANEANGPRISTRASRVSAWVIPTNEELMIARHTRELARASA